MRYEGEVRWRTVGPVDAEHYSFARKVIGKEIADMAHFGRTFGSRVFNDGDMVIVATVINNLGVPQVHASVSRLSDAQKRYRDQRSRTYVRQYVFAHSGQEWEMRPLGAGFFVGEVPGFAATLVTFTVFEGVDANNADHFALPLASSRSGYGAAPFVDPLDLDAYLPVKGYIFEVGGACANNKWFDFGADGQYHLLTPWHDVPTFPASLGNRSLGHLAFNPKYYSSYQADSDTWKVFTDNAYANMDATDTGYERSLSVVPDLPVEGPSFTPTDLRYHAAADSDWYESYGVQAVDDATYGPRVFGIQIDSSQRIHVFPLEADGTTTAQTASPSYLSQAIKTNVASEYVRSQDIPFPAKIYVDRQGLRDSGATTDALAFARVSMNSTRYNWAFTTDGRKAVTVAIERLGDVLPVYSDTSQPLWRSNLGTAGLTKEESEVREERTHVVELQIVITVGGPRLEDFDFTVSASEVPTDGYPVHAGYTVDAYAGADRDDLIVAELQCYYPVASSERWYPYSHTYTLERLWHEKFSLRPHVNTDLYYLAKYHGNADVRIVNKTQGNEIRRFGLAHCPEATGTTPEDGYIFDWSSSYRAEHFKAEVVSMDLSTLSYLFVCTKLVRTTPSIRGAQIKLFTHDHSRAIVAYVNDRLEVTETSDAGFDAAAKLESPVTGFGEMPLKVEPGDYPYSENQGWELLWSPSTFEGILHLGVYQWMLEDADFLQKVLTPATMPLAETYYTFTAKQHFQTRYPGPGALRVDKSGSYSLNLAVPYVNAPVEFYPGYWESGVSCIVVNGDPQLNGATVGQLRADVVGVRGRPYGSVHKFKHKDLFNEAWGANEDYPPNEYDIEQYFVGPVETTELCPGDGQVYAMRVKCREFETTLHNFMHGVSPFLGLMDRDWRVQDGKTVDWHWIPDFGYGRFFFQRGSA